MSILSRLAARTPEEVARRRFALWAGASLIILLPLWWFWGADLLIGMLRPVAELMLQLFGLTGRIDVLPGGGWSIGTPLTESGSPLRLPVSQETLRRLLLSFPLLTAFMIAPPRVERVWRALAISAPVLCFVFVVSLALAVWGELAPMLSPDLAMEGMKVTVRPDQPPLHPFVAQVVIVGRYVAYSVSPLLTALLLWVTVNPLAVRTLGAELRD